MQNNREQFNKYKIMNIVKIRLKIQNPIFSYNVRWDKMQKPHSEG